MTDEATATGGEPPFRVDLLTREYPPEVYGGAGVHVEELARQLRTDVDVDVRVRCFGVPRDEPGVTAYPEPAGLRDANAALRTMGVDLEIAAACAGADVVHSHTWYANLAGHVAKLLHERPHVVTTHSLEPLRPWKAEQLGGGYALSSFCERTVIEAADAIIAVSAGMRDDVLAAYPAVDPGRVTVVHNGIDLDVYAPDPRTDVLERIGVAPDRPSVVFVGRITRQKGLPYLLRAARELPTGTQVVLLAGAPDTPEIEAEVTALIDGLRSQRDGVVWVPAMLPKPDVVQVLTHATVFACPSIYEPMGIVNLEAMACETAVVATATGGIPEVVADGQTGVLVPIDQVTDGSGTPTDPDRFVADLAAALVSLLDDPERATELGRAGRDRARDHFSWPAIAERTMAVYRGWGRPEVQNTGALYDELTRKNQRAIVLRAVLRTGGLALGVFVVYFTAPFDAETEAMSLVLLTLAVIGLVPLVVWQIRSVLRSQFPAVRAVEALGAIVSVLFVVFASIYYLMGEADPATFSEPLTRIDVLYFTITVFATVGFGDITAKGEVARMIVSGQMLLDLVVLGFGLRALIAAVQLNRQRRGGSPHPGDDGPVSPP